MLNNKEPIMLNLTRVAFVFGTILLLGGCTAAGTVFDNNCSGIGVKPGHPSWRKYKTKLDWFIDLNNLLEKPIYKEKYTTFKKMRGVYVQPGSDNWVNGATKKYNDFMAITTQAEIDRQALAQSHIDAITALVTFPENIN